jgi:hypothetical protein
MRWTVDTGESLLAVTSSGDVVEYGARSAAGVRKLKVASSDTFRVDDVAYSTSKGILVVPFLSSKQDKVVTSPPHQVVLYKRSLDSRVSLQAVCMIFLISE